jgi:hypothetical protein
MPPDTEIVPGPRTIGTDRLVAIANDAAAVSSKLPRARSLELTRQSRVARRRQRCVGHVLSPRAGTKKFLPGIPYSGKADAASQAGALVSAAAARHVLRRTEGGVVPLLAF